MELPQAEKRGGGWYCSIAPFDCLRQFFFSIQIIGFTALIALESPLSTCFSYSFVIGKPTHLLSGRIVLLGINQYVFQDVLQPHQQMPYQGNAGNGARPQRRTRGTSKIAIGSVASWQGVS